MNVIYLLVLISVLTQNIFPQKISNQQIISGLNAAYNFDFDKAENIFNRIIKDNPEHPAGYYFISQIYLWKYMGGNDKGDKGIFLKYTDLSIEKGEAEIDKNKSPEFYFFLGSANQLKALSLIYEGEFFDAYGYVKDAINNLEECLELNSSYYDAYLGLGIFNYTLSYVPSFYRFIMGIFGLSSDKQKGFEQIKIAAEKGFYNKYEAEFYKARLLADYKAEYDSSSSISNRLISKFPNNIFLLYQDAATSLYRGDIKSAEKSIDKIIELSYPDFQQTNSFAFLRMGDIFFMKNQFKKAINFYDKFLNETRSFEFSGYAYYQIALCYAFARNDLETKRNLIFARNGNLDIPEDYYSKKKSEYFFENGFPKEYLILIKAENFVLINDFENAELLLDGIDLNKDRSKDISGKAHYLKAKIQFSKRNFEASIKSARKIKLDNLKFEKWISAASKILISQAYFELKDYEKSEAFAEQAEIENKFEYSEQLEAKIRNIQFKLADLKNSSKKLK